MKTQHNSQTVKQSNSQTVTNFASLALVTVLAFTPELALAAASNPIQSMLDWIIGFLTSGVMRSLAILAVITLGVAAYLGKITWELAGKIILGIVFTFGAPALVDQFSSNISG